MFDISLVPITVSTALAMIFGMVWYSQRVFGAVWMKEAGLDPAVMNAPEGMGKSIVAGLLQNFVIIYILAHVLMLAEAYPGSHTMVAAMWVAILVAASHLGSVIWEKRSLNYYSITAGYYVVMVYMSAFVITRWPWA